MSLSNKLAQKISLKLDYDDEKCAVINYGIFAFLQTLASLAIITLLGILLGMVWQALVVTFSASILRQYSGGVHATSPNICLIVGTVATLTITLAAHHLTGLVPVEILITINALLMASSYWLVIKYAPVDSPAKPIRTEHKRKKMKRFSLIVLTAYFTIIVVLVVMYLTQENSACMEFAMCIGMATGWQVFNLTKKGHRWLKKVDSILAGLLLNKGEHK